MLELLVAASKMVDKLAVSEMKPMIFKGGRVFSGKGSNKRCDEKKGPA